MKTALLLLLLCVSSAATASDPLAKLFPFDEVASKTMDKEYKEITLFSAQNNIIALLLERDGINLVFEAEGFDDDLLEIETITIDKGETMRSIFKKIGIKLNAAFLYTSVRENILRFKHNVPK